MRKVQNAGWFSEGILTHGRKSNNTIMIPKKMNNNNNKKRKTSSSSSFFLMISRTRFILKKKKPTYTQVLTDNFFLCVYPIYSQTSHGFHFWSSFSCTRMLNIVTMLLSSVLLFYCRQSIRKKIRKHPEKSKHHSIFHCSGPLAARRENYLT